MGSQQACGMQADVEKQYLMNSPAMGFLDVGQKTMVET